MAVNFGTITASIQALLGDEAGPVSGDVLFTPTVEGPVVIDGEYISPQVAYATFVAGNLVAVTDAQALRLLATDQGNPTGWTWHVQFRLTSKNGAPIRIAPFDIQVPSGSSIDLTSVTPVPGNDGVFYLVPQMAVGTVTTLNPGTPASVTISLSGSTYILSFGIPKGDKGDPGSGGGGGGSVDSVNGQTGVVVLDAADVGAATMAQVATAISTALAGYVSDSELAAAIAGFYTKPGTGIPKTDLSSAVQTSLGKADSALQTVPSQYVDDSELAAALAALTPASIGAQPAGNYASATDLNNVFTIATDAQAVAEAAVPSTQKGANGGVATLDGSGHIPQAQIPAVAITEYLGTVASQAAMLALSGQVGDWAIRSDLGTTWIITGSDPTQLSSWTQVAYPASPVQSVAGRTGAVTISSTDITDATATGRSLITAASAAAARTAIGAGTSSLVIGTTGTTAKAGNWVPAAADISDGTATGRALLTAGSAASALSTLGAQPAGDYATNSALATTDAKAVAAQTTANAAPPAAKLWRGTQAAYDALGSYDSTTVYVIAG